VFFWGLEKWPREKSAGSNQFRREFAPRATSAKRLPAFEKIHCSAALSARIARFETKICGHFCNSFMSK
jgi:hypothetical protein